MKDKIDNTRKNRHKKRKISLWKKLFLGGFLLLILCVAIGAGYFLSIYSKMDKVALDKSSLGIAPNAEFDDYKNANKIINIALFGIDSEDGGVGRSDSIMVATLDPVHKKLKLTSIMRDSYVEIPGRSGKDKINHAYAFGGPQLAIQTLNQNFGLNIESFASVNFTSLPKIIDALGGIDLNITTEELKYINGYIDSLNSQEKTTSPHIKKVGNQHVDGIQALAYSRIRYTSGGDYQRTERHRTVLTSLFNKIMSTPVNSYPSLINKLLPFVKTNLSATEILNLGSKVLSIGNNNLIQDRFPRDENCNGIKVNGIYYLDYDRDITIKQIRDYIFNDIV